MAKLTNDDAMRLATEAGAMTAQGADGILYLAKVAFGATRSKAIDPKTGIRDLYVAYLGAANASEYGSRVNAKDDKALKFGASKLRTFAKLAALPGKPDDVWNLVRRSVAVINKGDGESKKIGSRYEQVLKVVRAANNAKSYKLSDAQIVDAITPKAADIDDITLHELERLLRAAKAILARGDEASNRIPTDRTGYIDAVRAAAEESLAQYKADHGIVDEDEAETSEDEDFDLDADEMVATLQAAE